MKILQVVPYFFPAYAFGGPVKVAYQISRELVKRGHDVVVYTSDARDIDSRLITDPFEVVNGIKVHYYRNLSMIPVKMSKLFLTPQIVSNVKEEIERFDVIHFHEYRTFQNIVMSHYAKKYGVPYVVQAHGSLPRHYGKSELKWFYDALFGYRLLRDASRVVALNRVEAQQYRDMGVPREKVEIIPNGIDLSEYADLPPKGSFRKRYGIKEEKKIILYLGRIHESKGIGLLLKAYAYLNNDMGFKHSVLVVAGPDDGFLAEAGILVNSLGISDSVIFTGFISSEDKLGALVDAEVFVTPFFYGFPITFLEACLAGCPIVTASDDLDWIQDNVGYVTKDPPVALAKGIASVLQDEQVNRRFRNNCKQMIKKFSISMVTRQLEEVYKVVSTRIDD